MPKKSLRLPRVQVGNFRELGEAGRNSSSMASLIGVYRARDPSTKVECFYTSLGSVVNKQAMGRGRAMKVFKEGPFL